MSELPQFIDGLPNISGWDEARDEATHRGRDRSVFLHESGIDFGRARGACAVALHMHQPLIPAGGPGRGADPRHEPLVGNLRFMEGSPFEEDRHNADVYRRCYRRPGEFIPQMVCEGRQPRLTLDYTGTLFLGLQQMGAHDVLDALRTLACDPRYRRCVEWLGTTWGHTVAPSTPPQDFRLHVTAWQNHFASLFGLEALSRVRGFMPSELALPNHPDVAYEFVKTLKDCGYRWAIVQEHTVENPDSGWGSPYLHLPNRMVCTNSRGETASIVVLIKTRGSDTKIVGHMQPYDEACSQSRWDYRGRKILPLVTQIADGENGHVMMNEFPGTYLDVVRRASGSDVPLVNPTEYLEYLSADGWREEDFPVVQPVRQKRIWERFRPGEGPEKLAQVIEQLRREDYHFHVEGGSWTNDISWIYGYENVLGPMEKASALFYEKVLRAGVWPGEQRYRNALFHLLTAQTSCFRYWGQGRWTDYGREISRRALEILTHDF
ncbi:MAG: glycosyl hydrolase family 57 [Verrucomicrobia bacterium]|nr:glycosyl hydrolase family 57 [Verrucomicrobiota bacterium]